MAFPERYHLFPTAEKVANIAYGVGYILFAHLMWDTEGRTSNHRPDIYSMTDQEVMDEWKEQGIGEPDEWRKVDLQADVDHLIKQLGILTVGGENATPSQLGEVA